MSKRTDSHTLSHAENIYSGDAYQAGAEGNGRGIPRASLVQVSLGAPSIADVNGIAAQDSGAGGPFPFDLTIDGALASGGVATFDVPRGVQVVSAGADTGSAVFVFYGTDKYGVEIQESVTSNGTTIVFGKKAFKTVTRVSVSADTTASYNVGDSDILGLPFRLENVSDVLVIDENDQNLFQVTGQTAANPASATAAASALTASATDALTAVDFTDNSSGTPADTLEDCNAAITAVNGSGATTQQETDINALTVAIANNIASLGRQADRALVDAADQKVAIDQNVVDVADQKEEIDKLITDVEAIRAEVIKLVTDAAAVDSGTLVKADATVTATATTGDVRGTYNPTMVLDGSKIVKLTFKPKGRNTRAAYGSVQYRA